MARPQEVAWGPISHFFQRFHLPDFYASFPLSFPICQHILGMHYNAQNGRQIERLCGNFKQFYNLIPKTQSRFLFSCYFHWQPQLENQKNHHPSSSPIASIEVRKYCNFKIRCWQASGGCFGSHFSFFSKVPFARLLCQFSIIFSTLSTHLGHAL